MSAVPWHTSNIGNTEHGHIPQRLQIIILITYRHCSVQTIMFVEIVNTDVPATGTQLLLLLLLLI